LAIRPITLLIDRAGGGKTNLLCRLAEDLGKKYICFFLAARSIISPNEDAIQRHLDSSYPLGQNSIQAALRSAKGTSKPVLVIIDGINECVDPVGFNMAVKAFVRRYYRSRIRFIISCRDIGRILGIRGGSLIVQVFPKTNSTPSVTTSSRKPCLYTSRRTTFRQS
jgi:hypothetical protein